MVYLGRKTRRSPSPASAELPPEGPEDCDPPPPPSRQGLRPPSHTAHSGHGTGLCAGPGWWPLPPDFLRPPAVQAPGRFLLLSAGRVLSNWNVTRFL